MSKNNFSFEKRRKELAKKAKKEEKKNRKAEGVDAEASGTEAGDAPAAETPGRREPGRGRLSSNEQVSRWGGCGWRVKASVSGSPGRGDTGK